MPLQLWLPESAREAPDRVCNVCGTHFPARQRSAWQRHCVRCIRKNPEAAEQRAHERDDNFLTGVADREAHDFYRRRGAK